MGSTITIRDVDPDDKNWLQSEAKKLGLSMEELARRIIHEKRERVRRDEKPSDVFRRYFGEEGGVELPSRQMFKGKAPIDFSGEEYGRLEEETKE